MKNRVIKLGLFLGAQLLAVTSVIAQSAGHVEFPNPAWQSAPPESVGFYSQRLESLRSWLKTEPTTAMMVIVHGKVIFQYGDVAKVSKIASIRKSILSALYGNYVVTGKIDTTKNVKELGLGDMEPFLPFEEKATLEQLLTARSGVYMDPRTDELTRQQPSVALNIPELIFSTTIGSLTRRGRRSKSSPGKTFTMRCNPI